MSIDKITTYCNLILCLVNSLLSALTLFTVLYSIDWPWTSVNDEDVMDRTQELPNVEMSWWHDGGIQEPVGLPLPLPTTTSTTTTTTPPTPPTPSSSPSSSSSSSSPSSHRAYIQKILASKTNVPPSHAHIQHSGTTHPTTYYLLYYYIVYYFWKYYFLTIILYTTSGSIIF